jgi:protein-disulfide isomerase
MNKYNLVYNNIYKCSYCSKEYRLPWHKDDSTGDKIYDYEIIDYSIIQTECPYCTRYNCKQIKR